jgi:hypothetical protein
MAVALVARQAEASQGLQGLGFEPGEATGAGACGFGVKTHAKPTLQHITLTNARLSPQSPVTYPNHPA